MPVRELMMRSLPQIVTWSVSDARVGQIFSHYGRTRTLADYVGGDKKSGKMD
jgi:hypothetical protein